MLTSWPAIAASQKPAARSHRGAARADECGQGVSRRLALVPGQLTSALRGTQHWKQLRLVKGSGPALHGLLSGSEN